MICVYLTLFFLKKKRLFSWTLTIYQLWPLKLKRIIWLPANSRLCLPTTLKCRDFFLEKSQFDGLARVSNPQSLADVGYLISIYTGGRVRLVYSARCLHKPIMWPVGVVKGERLGVAIFRIFYRRRPVPHRNDALRACIFLSLKRIIYINILQYICSFLLPLFRYMVGSASTLVYLVCGFVIMNTTKFLVRKRGVIIFSNYGSLWDMSVRQEKRVSVP